MSRSQATRFESAGFAHQGGLALEHRHVEPETQAVAGFEEIVGRDTTLRELLETVRDVAGTDSTILFSGGNGTGEGLGAQGIHTLSARRGRGLGEMKSGEAGRRAHSMTGCMQRWGS